MNNLWYEFIINKFATHKGIHCCGGCQGGCLNPAVCVFVCLDYTMEDINKYIKKVGKQKLVEEFRIHMLEGVE